MNMIQFLGALELGLIYALVALGVYLTFRAINFPDLTVDGSFPLGAAVCAALIVKEIHPVTATLAAFFAGTLAGFVTGFLSVRWKILGLLAGILTMTALYSINLRVMGRPNIAIMNEPTLFSLWPAASDQRLYIIVGIVIFTTIILWGFLSSQLGLGLRAVGINSKVCPAYGISVGRATLLGLMVSNGLVALGGALFAQTHGFADTSLGNGTLITGLASVIIGESLLHKHKIFLVLISVILGSILYRIFIALALNTKFAGIEASDLNLITAILVVVAMLIPKFRQSFQNYRLKNDTIE